MGDMGEKKSLMVFLLPTIFIMALLLVPLIPPSLAATCPSSMTQVDASLSPSDDENGNGLICQYTREAAERFPSVTVYQDDMIEQQ